MTSDTMVRVCVFGDIFLKLSTIGHIWMQKTAFKQLE